MKHLMIIAIILLAGCTSQKEIMNSWMGSTKQNLYMSWGPPSAIASDGKSGEIHTWSVQGVYQMSYGPVNYWEHRRFWINSDDKVYHWQVQRSQIPPTQLDVRIR